MKIKIFQINGARDQNRVRFENIENTEQYQGFSQLDAAIYDEVFSGDVGCAELEDVYALFNSPDTPPLHRGHSLSVSDVIATSDGHYFVDSVGFQKVAFNETQAQKPDDLRRIVMVEPGKPAYEAEIEDSLRSYQRAVGGNIEVTYPFTDEAVIVSNEEAKCLGMAGNRRIGGDIYAGAFIIIGAGTDGKFASLTDAQIAHYLEKFSQPETIAPEEVEATLGFEFLSF
ncbi:MAG: DUF3846 domain-containing protein [Oscillospiraceae bacterium]|jgi:hypothetical protein|nr:DUF3846 domain-containing protein [Oscillospiraceae bacterium]